MIRRRLARGGLLLVLAACSDSTGPTPPPAAVAARLDVTGQPSAQAQSGVPFATQPVVRLRSATGAYVAQAGRLVTATLVTPGAATLSGATATTNSSGTATFTALAISGLVGSYTLRFSADTLTPADASPLTLAAGPPAQIALATQPSATAAAGQSLAQQPAVQLRDAAGNDAAQAGITVSAELVSGAATLAGQTAVTNAAGLATFSSLTVSGAAGAYTLRFTAGTLGSVNAAAATAVGPGPATQLALATQPSTTAQNAAPLATQPVVQLRDAFGNAATTAGVKIGASLTSGLGALTGDTVVTDAQGRAAFTALRIVGQAGNFGLRFAATGLASVVAAAPVALAAGTAMHLSVTTAPPFQATSGQPLTTQPVVQLVDTSGNAVSQAGVVVTASVVGGGLTLSNAVDTTDAAGKATFSALTLTGTQGGYQLQFTAAGLTTALSPFATQLLPGAASQLQLFRSPPATAANATPFAAVQQPIVRVLDASGNVVDTSNVVVTASLQSGTGTLSGHVDTTQNGQAAFTALAITGVTGSYTLQFSAPGLGTVVATATNLTFGAATRLHIVTGPASSAVSGTPLSQQPAVQLRDVSDNPVLQGGVLVTASIVGGGPAVSNGQAVTALASGTATFVGLTLTGTSGTYTMRFSVPGLTGADTTVVLGAGAPTQLFLTTPPPSSAQNGVALSPQPVVQLRDAQNNPVGRAGDVITASVVGGGATVSNATATTNGSGVATFAGLALTGPVGSYVLRFSSGSLAPVDAPVATSLSPGPPAQVTLGPEPPKTAVNAAPLAAQPAVQVRDVAGNPVALPGVNVQASLVAGAPALAGSSAVTDAAGLAQFTALGLTGFAGSYTLRFTAAGVGFVDAGSSTALVAGPATQATLATQPAAAAQSGAALPTQPVVQLRDVSGNAVPQAGVTVSASVVGGGPAVQSATADTDAAGVATFNGLALTGTVGTYTLRFTPAGLPAVDASAGTALGPGAAVQLALTTAPPATAVDGLVFGTTPVVRVRDASANNVPQAGVTVTASLVSGSATVGGATAVTDGNGIATFGSLGLSGPIGSYTLRFSAPGLGSLDAPAATSLTAGTATDLSVSTEPSAGAANGVALAVQPQVTVVSGINPVAGAVITASLTSAGASVVNGTAVTGANGVATFSGLALAGAVGPYTLRFSSGAVSADAAGPTTLSAGAAAALALTQQPSLTAVNAAALTIQPVVRVTDAGGNFTADAGRLVTASVLSGAVVVSSATATTDGSGTATFAGLTLTGAVGSHTLRFSAAGLASVNAAAPTALSEGASSRVSIDTEPATSALLGQALAVQPVVRLRDPSGNPVAQAGVTVTATDMFGTATLTNATAVTNASGVATFSGLSVTAPRGIHWLRFTAPAMAPDTATDSLFIAAPVTSGVPVQPSGGTANAQDVFAITVPPGATRLTVTISGPVSQNSDADLYVRFGQAPDPFDYHPAQPWPNSCVPSAVYSNETCIFDLDPGNDGQPNQGSGLPQAGTWYIIVYAFFTYTGVTLTATVN